MHERIRQLTSTYLPTKEPQSTFVEDAKSFDEPDAFNRNRLLHLLQQRYDQDSSKERKDAKIDPPTTTAETLNTANDRAVVWDGIANFIENAVVLEEPSNFDPFEDGHQEIMVRQQ